VLVIDVWPPHSPYFLSSLLFSVLWPRRGSLYARDLNKRAFSHMPCQPRSTWPYYQQSTQTHPHQPNANSYMLLLDVGYSVLGPVTSSRRCAAFFVFFKSPSLIWRHGFISPEGESRAGTLRCHNHTLGRRRAAGSFLRTSLADSIANLGFMTTIQASWFIIFCLSFTR